MHALGHPKHHQPVAVAEPADDTLILTVGVPRGDNEKQIITLGDVSLEHLPHFESFASAIAAAGVRHKPVVVRYLPGAPTLDVSHVECRLSGIAQFPLLQTLLDFTFLTSLLLELPFFGPDALPPLTLPSLTALSLRGELPCAYQFIAALYAPALGKLSISFHRNQWDKLDALADPLRDEAYSLCLFPQSFPALRTVTLAEEEPHPRWSDVSLGCALRPLLHLPTLEDVEVRLDASPLWVSDEDVAHLAASWPWLRRLVLTCRVAANRCPSLGALLHLEAHGRELVELVLPKLRLDCDLADFMPLVPDDGAVQGTPSGLVGTVGAPQEHPLRTLRVACQTSGTVSKEHCVALGQRLAALFPNLETDTQFLSAASAELYTSDWYSIWMGVQSAKAVGAPLA
ncbi:hypothetical protein C8Q76DRAFT_186122 [Earliella scabrosa]|nr:hypothetical protein C8Q76DRAFT_186122 [Earliella scabrosa]